MHCICNTQKEKSRRRRRVLAPVCSRCQTLWRLGVPQATPIFSLSHLPFRTILPPLVCYFLSPLTATSATPRRVLTLFVLLFAVRSFPHTRSLAITTIEERMVVRWTVLRSSFDSRDHLSSRYTLRG